MAQSKKNLEQAIKLYVDKTHTLGVELDIENDCPCVSWYVDDNDNTDCYIKHLSFTDSGKLADVTLLAWSNYDEITITAEDFMCSGADFDEVAFAILYH